MKPTRSRRTPGRTAGLGTIYLSSESRHSLFSTVFLRPEDALYLQHDA